ncbi:MAG: class II aldolase/adducin family protein [Betaproteobacteria bacterium]|nr:class II aldolase/adducin family protein [Betaproteobacteria bacterium]
MDLSESVMRHKPAGMTAEEWALRLELAACYRAFDWMGWSELIYNHITARVPGPERHYLINPYGLWYNEVTASNLVKVNLEGKVVDGSKYPVNVAGFVIHSAIHAAREDAHCVIHTHTTAGSAVSCKREGLRYDNFYSAILHGDVAYHDFEGTTVDTTEQPRLVASLGGKHVLILRNHGLLAIGSCIADAFIRYWTLERACQVQAATDAMQGDNLPVAQAVLEDTPRRIAPFRAGPRPGGEVFDALLRRAGIRYEDIV